MVVTVVTILQTLNIIITFRPLENNGRPHTENMQPTELRKLYSLLFSGNVSIVTIKLKDRTVVLFCFFTAIVNLNLDNLPSPVNSGTTEIQLVPDIKSNF